MRVIVSTCNRYNFLIPIFTHFYKKNWPDNPYQTEIITETDHIDGAVFYTGGVSWASGIINYLKQSKEDKFLLILDDYIIDKIVDTKRIEQAESLCEGNVGCVKLNAPDKWFINHAISTNVHKGFREYPLDKQFSMSLQTAIWQKSYLLDVLRDGETPWQTEVDGSERLKGMASKWQILWSETPIIEYISGGFMRHGRVRLSVMIWVISDLLKDRQT